MKKVMSYKNEPIDYASRLKYILVNIIEMIPELRELKIEYIINEESQFRSWFEFYNSKLESFRCGVELNIGDLITDDNKFRTTLFIKDLFRYFSMYNITEEELNIAIWIFVSLHELGHIKYYNRFKLDYKYLEKINDRYNDNISNILNRNNIEYMESYFMLPTELYADQFAYRYFPYVWNNLKYMNLI